MAVGFASAKCDRARQHPIGVIEAIYVEPSARLVGVGEAMLDVVVAWFAERGCQGVDAPALPGSRPAKAFFEDHGFVARLLTMHHPLPASGRESMAELRPELCVGAVAVDEDQLLLIRRGHGPAQGLWSVPGGRVEAGETLAEAVVRELLEETGLEGVCESLVGWAERIEADFHYVILDFWVTIVSEDPVAGTTPPKRRGCRSIKLPELSLTEGLAEFLHDHGLIAAFS